MLQYYRAEAPYVIRDFRDNADEPRTLTLHTVVSFQLDMTIVAEISCGALKVGAVVYGMNNAYGEGELSGATLAISEVRRTDVLAYLAKGFGDRETSHTLSIAEKTVRTYNVLRFNAPDARLMLLSS